jgi:hypothetical protein
VPRPPSPTPGPAGRLAGSVLLALALLVPITGCTGDDGVEPPTTSGAPDGGANAPTTAHGGTSDVTTNPAAQDTGPGIARFEAPATVTCEGPTAQVDLVWEAPSADVVRLLVDGDDVGSDQPPTGTTTVDVPCDGSIHVILLAAVGADGATSVRSEAVMAEPEG